MNVGNPELAFEFSQLPNAGVGLARVEFIINNVIGIHPKAIPRRPDRDGQHALAGKNEEGRESLPGLLRWWRQSGGVAPA